MPETPELYTDECEVQLMNFALSLPDTTEASPWGHWVAKVNGKMFFITGRDDGLGVTVKLPVSGASALKMREVEPTGYGMGKHGWVSGYFPEGSDGVITSPPDMEMLRAWLLESYVAVAPKKTAAKLAGMKGLPEVKAGPARGGVKKVASKPANRVAKKVAKKTAKLAAKQVAKKTVKKPAKKAIQKEK